MRMLCECSLVGLLRFSNADILKTKDLFKLPKTPSCRALKVLLGNVKTSEESSEIIGETFMFTKKKTHFQLFTPFVFENQSM